MEYIFILVTTLINFLVLAFIKSFNNNYITNLILFLNIVVNIVILLKSDNKYKIHIVLSYILRCIFMFFDFYGRNVFILPHAGADTENFYNAGLLYMKSGSVIKEHFFGGLYSKFIGIILKVIGDNELFIQYINVTLAVLTIFLLIRILENLSIEDEIESIMIIILCYLPNNIIISSLTLRESWIIYLATLCILYYIKYIIYQHYFYLLISIISIMLSALFHSGMILILIPILIVEILKNKNKNLLINAILIIGTLLVIYIYRDTIFSKFITQRDIILSKDSYGSEAGSRYLSSVYINSISDIIKYGWLKSIYFLASPTILYWRGISDILSFGLDSLVYIILSLRIIFVRTKVPEKYKQIYLTLIFSLIITVFTFGLGTSTAGTAIRHRNKLLVLLIVAAAISENFRINSSIYKTRRIKLQNSDKGDIYNYAQYLKINLPIILTLAILLGAVGYGVSKYVLTPKYDSNATMIVSNSTSTDSQNPQDSNVELGQIQANKALISTYSEIVKSRGIADKVISNLNLDMDYGEFSEKVSIEPVKDTQIISVKVVDTIPERAQDIANETANIFKDSIGDIMKVDNVQILDGATLPSRPSSPNIKKNTAIGVALGLILGVMISIFKELADTTIKSQDDINKYFDLPVIGIIPDKKQG